MSSDATNSEVKNLLITFLDAQKKLFEFIQQHSELLVQFNSKDELNYTYIGKCGHRYPDYYRIADISLYGNRYQICCCAKCGGQISLIPYPCGWESGEEILGVPIEILPEDAIDYISLHCDTDEDVDYGPGMFRDISQHAAMMKIEIDRKEQNDKK
ncbi:MAG: hypothetical protein LBK06_01350 [Planctomycetaceae bacterium]|jgi:hypothetical protein|nr:hypothetical protein [Planctomycetaceae bacterium]